MKTTAKIIRIGNSQGVRLSKRVLEEAQLGSEVVVEVRGGEVVLRSAEDPREGWEESARLMHERGEDKLLLGEIGTSEWDLNEWKW